MERRVVNGLCSKFSDCDRFVGLGNSYVQLLGQSAMLGVVGMLAAGVFGLFINKDS